MNSLLILLSVVSVTEPKDAPFLDLGGIHKGDYGYINDVVEVSQVIDDNNMLVRNRGKTFWLEVVDQNTPTLTSVVDGARFRMYKHGQNSPLRWLVVGTTRYRTVLGSTKTVWKLRWISQDELDRLNMEWWDAYWKAAKRSEVDHD